MCENYALLVNIAQLYRCCSFTSFDKKKKVTILKENVRIVYRDVVFRGINIL